jgi:hypothetical protein
MVHNLRGQLGDGVLANLIQYLALNRASGGLLVNGLRGLIGEIFLDGGRVVHAATAGQRAVPAVATMLSWGEGSFAFRDGLRAPEVSIDASLEQLLLSAAYHADTHGNGARVSPEAVLAPVDLAALPLGTQVPVAAFGLLRALDGRRSLGEAARQAGMGLEAAVRVADELLVGGLIVPRGAPAVSAGAIDELTAHAVRAVGPVGEIIVEDALLDLNLERDGVARSSAAALVHEIAAQIKHPEQRRRFEQQAQGWRQKYRL